MLSTSPKSGNLSVDRSGRDDTILRLQKGKDALTRLTAGRIEGQLPWFRRLSPSERKWVVHLAHAGITSFIEWYRNPDAPVGIVSEIFHNAPRELMRTISLQQTLQLLRVVVEVVEEHVAQLGNSTDVESLREGVLVFSREIAFAAADVYARAAEARGSWDVRLEAMVIDALMRGDSVDELASRTAAYGWRSKAAVHVIIGRASARTFKGGLSEVRSAAQRAGEDALVGIHDNRLLIVLGGATDIDRAVGQLLQYFGPQEVVIGPRVASLAEAGASAAAASWALRTAYARPNSPRPVFASDLLPERAMAGDQTAVNELVRTFYEPLSMGSGQLLTTAENYVDFGGSLEATAKALEVHPNTVRYRLRKIQELIGLDATQARAGFVLRIALVFGRLTEGM